MRQEAKEPIAAWKSCYEVLAIEVKLATYHDVFLQGQRFSSRIHLVFFAH